MVHDVKTYTNVIAHKLLQQETIAINYYNNKTIAINYYNNKLLPSIVTTRYERKNERKCLVLSKDYPLRAKSLESERVAPMTCNFFSNQLHQPHVTTHQW
jgi:hypothetical protein